MGESGGEMGEWAEEDVVPREEYLSAAVSEIESAWGEKSEEWTARIWATAVLAGAGPGALFRQREICEALPFTASTVSRQLAALEKVGVVTRQRIGRQKVVRVECGRRDPAKLAEVAGPAVVEVVQVCPRPRDGSSLSLP